MRRGRTEIASIVLIIVVLGVAIATGIYIVDKVNTSSGIPSLQQSYTATNSTSLTLGASLENKTHTISLGISGLSTKYLVSYGSLEINFTSSAASNSSQVYVNNHLVGTINGGLTSPYTFTNVSASWLLEADPIVVKYSGYNMTITYSKLTIQSDTQEYQISQAQQNTVSNVASALNIASILPIVLVAVVILGALMVLLKVGG